MLHVNRFRILFGPSVQLKAAWSCRGSRAISMKLPWSKKKEVPEEVQELEAVAKRKPDTDESHASPGFEYERSLSHKKRSITNQNSYKPPEDLAMRMRKVVEQNMDTSQGEWSDLRLTDSRLKFKVLSALVKEFRHDIPCASLSEISTTGQALEYFSKEVRTGTSLDALALQKLPRNVSIQLEPLRFDANRDSGFGQLNALPGQDTVVTSIKFRRKYSSIRQTEARPGFVNHYYSY